MKKTINKNTFNEKLNLASMKIARNSRQVTINEDGFGFILVREGPIEGMLEVGLSIDHYLAPAAVHLSVQVLQYVGVETFHNRDVTFPVIT